ncbi:unnamed protein product [Polarella glacialis]|uniref:Uncharacterized protein n=1 Tax=Polarella glacialis TaxID=89957 RepID=A0A813FAJ1_POLGL|nr:unnamed protein product [Polarella glacialis]
MRSHTQACEQVRLCWAAFLGNFATPEASAIGMHAYPADICATSSCLAVGEFVKEKWQLPKQQEILITFRDADNDECIFNETNFQDLLTCTSEEKIWFTVHLPWADRFKLRPCKPSEPRSILTVSYECNKSEAARTETLDLKLPSPKEAGDALFTAIFESAPTLQSLFTTPKAVQSMRFVHELDSFVATLNKPKALKNIAESLAFRHLNLDVTEGGEDADGLPKRDAGRRAPSSTSKLGNRIKNRKITSLLASSKEPVKSSQGTFVLLKGGMGSDDMVVPTNYREMFEFNSAVMGFSGSSWLPEVLDSFDSIVVHAADSNRLQQECDLLAVRISKKVSGTVNLSQYKSCMLASLRSLLPKEWDSNYEVAWNWLWDNVERLIVKNVEKPPVWEAAVRNMMDSFGPEEMYRIRALIFERFFVAAASGQEYFKQSDTRLHFIMEKVLQMTVDMFQDPWQLTDDISALGLRHVGYGIPTQLFGPFVSCCVEVIGEATDSKNGLEGFRWSLALISRLLVRTITEGSTIVMKAVNSNSARQLQTAISCAPRGSRAQWLLNIEVGTHAISPLFWSIESGSLDAARAIIEDLLVIRADRERYYYGAPDLFLRHQDIMQRLCLEAPALLPTLLDGLVWRSTRTSNGLRRANYYIEHLMSNAQGEPADALRELCTTKDPKIMTHPVLVTLSDSLWSGVVQKQFLFERIWFICSLDLLKVVFFKKKYGCLFVSFLFFILHPYCNCKAALSSSCSSNPSCLRSLN